ncbi:hypothetical protein [Nocardia thailandica]|nr:hypothetical protein [Nocardia thailandica]
MAEAIAADPAGQVPFADVAAHFGCPTRRLAPGPAVTVTTPSSGAGG